MELMFAEWEDGERFSFEDSDRFEEDSLCSFISEAESLCQNWRGWRKQSAGPTSPTVKTKDGQVTPLVELSAKQVAFHIPFEVVEKVFPPVPEQLQLRIAYWSFPENEEDIRLYSCLANGSPDEFQRGEQLHRIRAVKDPLQIGFHLSATVVPSQSGQSKGAYNVAVMFDRCRITSCSCTCGAGAKWCAHVVALCLFRIHNASSVCLRAPVSESLSRLQRDQLQKFAQYLISELPQQILPTAQRLLDELLSSQSTAINTMCGAPDPTAGPSASDQSTWYLDESTLSDNIKKTLHKFCGPSPVVFSDVNSMYLSSTEPPAAAEWACLLRPLRGREPEGIWNLLSIVREMFKRRDSNAAPLLEILTEQCLTYEQIISWWYSVRTSASHSSASGHTARSNCQSEVAAHACASMCDEIVILWKLAVLDPTMSPCRRLELANHLKNWHLKVIEIVKRGQHRKSLEKLFQGFKPAVESCYFNWQMAYPLEGITYCSVEKKTANFCWPRGIKQQRAARASAGGMGETPEPGGPDCKATGSGHFFQEEVVVRPKETMLTKKKAFSVNGGGTMLVRLGGGLSLSREDGGGRCFYKGPGGTSGGKLKLIKGFGKGGILGGCKNINSKQRASSEDSSLDPDLSELSLDDGHNLALGAEASNTFEFLPPTPEMFPILSPLVPESCSNAYSSNRTKTLDIKHSQVVDGCHAVETLPPNLLLKKSDMVLIDTSMRLEGQQEQEADSEQNKDVDSSNSDQPFASSCNNSFSIKIPKTSAAIAADNSTPTVFGIAQQETEAANAIDVAMFEDDYQVYYLSPASEDGTDRQLVDNYQENPDVFAGIKPLDQEGRMEVLFACAEALHAHGYKNEACRLAVDLANELLANPPDLKVEQPQTKGKKNKVSTGRQTQIATNTLSKAAFLLTVLSDRLELHNLAFNTGMFSLELQRPPASTKALEVKLGYQESDIVALLKKLPMGLVEMSVIRARAEQLRDGNYCGYRPVLPLMLASFIFDVLCAPVVSPTGSNPPSRKHNSEMPGDEELGFGAAVAALGMKTTVSEAEHPLLCEGTRRVKGDLALALMITYKDDQSNLKKILDKLLDRESQTHKPQTLSSFYSSKPAAGSQRSPSKHGPSGSSETTLVAASSNSSAVILTCEELEEQKSVQKNRAARSTSDLVTGVNRNDCENESTPFKIDSTVPSRLALGARCGYSQRCWGSPARQKKKHTGMASIDSSAPETTSDSSPTLSRRPLRGGWAPTSWGRGQDSDSISSSSSDSLGSSSSSGSHRAGGGARAKSMDTSRYKGRRPECHVPHVPNQPSEAAAHFYFELAKTVLIKAGGNSSTSIFTQPSVSGAHQGPHRNLHLCAFEIGLYALGLHNFVSPNWLSRTYSSHVSWITGQAMEIGSAALTILMECWDGHLTPPEVASLADRASRARDLNMDNMMLEKACMAVEEAAKGGGVYPEVLFEVAHQWYWLYEHSIIEGFNQQRETSGRCRANGSINRRPPEASCGVFDGGTNVEVAGITVTGSVTAAAVVPVISVGSNMYQSHAISGQVMAHPHAHGLHPYATIQTHLPTVCTPQYLGHPLQHTPRPAVFPVSGAAYPQGMHSAFIGAQYPFPVAPVPSPSMTATAVTFPAISVPSLTQISYPYLSESSLPINTTVTVGSIHAGSTLQAIQGSSVSSQPSPLVSTSFPVEEEQHHQPISQQGMHYLHSAYRVGMLALEMLGRRAHNDHPNNFSRSPPYTEDVKWLLGLASRLGVNYVYQFCVGAAKGVLSPFVLQEIIMEALQRLNPAHIHVHLRTPAFHQLVQRCQQFYLQYIHHRLIHLTPADYDDFVNIIRSARSAFCLTPVGVMQLNDVLQNLKRGKQTKELWQRISLEMATFSP
ncbi:zinc finger SWIM domain-containing protein 8 isoform X3 [Syngnathoides biaculeatus]|uniref:zinc finger SWIM domain-containing protein 8 isoform X3 n=1 Tax=Syngnathoides biaculeatus TaxID=300417 RepID=UPI002ADE5E33|nr:zinc finger SWIM domain-containing protein 8 isoform X3 [Syngnathoides biaculeatus]